MKISSRAFSEQGEIPSLYTCQGKDVSPPLGWSGLPEGTKLAFVISCGAIRPLRWLKALRSTSIMTRSRNTVTAAAATVSYFRWPYG